MLCPQPRLHYAIRISTCHLAGREPWSRLKAASQCGIAKENLKRKLFDGKTGKELPVRVEQWSAPRRKGSALRAGRRRREREEGWIRATK